LQPGGHDEIDKRNKEVDIQCVEEAASRIQPQPLTPAS
jgi:hypothetical protein